MRTVFHVCADRGIDPAGTKGASIHLRSIATALAGQCTVVMLAARTSATELIGDNGATVPVERLDGPASIVAAAQRYGTPTAVYERYSLGSSAGLEAARSLGCPFVLEVNAPLQMEASRHRPETVDEETAAMEATLIASADVVIAVSHPLRDHLGPLRGGAPIVVVPNGCDPTAFAGGPRPDHRPTIGFLGHPKPWHGADRLVPLLAGVRHHGIDARLLLVGGGDGADQVAAAAAAAGLADSVDITGALGHHAAAAAIASAWVGVAPYHPEEFFYFCPLKVVEYMAAGVPVVASSLGDIPWLVGDAGTLVGAHDLDALVDETTRLLADPATRAAMGGRGRDRALRDLTWDAAAAATLAAIDQVSHGRPELS
jgi:glycosyltransferase involved in cell wall biosynthesis